MTTHYLKAWPEPFAAVLRGDKTFEYRKDDRDFAVGDLLVLQEWVPEGRAAMTGYTGAMESVIVTHKAEGGTFGIPEGYCVLSIQKPEGRMTSIMNASMQRTIDTSIKALKIAHRSLDEALAREGVLIARVEELQGELHEVKLDDLKRQLVGAEAEDQ